MLLPLLEKSFWLRSNRHVSFSSKPLPVVITTEENCQYHSFLLLCFECQLMYYALSLPVCKSHLPDCSRSPFEEDCTLCFICVSFYAWFYSCETYLPDFWKWMFHLSYSNYLNPGELWKWVERRFWRPLFRPDPAPPCGVLINGKIRSHLITGIQSPVLRGFHVGWC